MSVKGRCRPPIERLRGGCRFKARRERLMLKTQAMIVRAFVTEHKTDG